MKQAICVISFDPDNSPWWYMKVGLCKTLVSVYCCCRRQVASVVSCRGPAPADPGYSKGRRRRPIQMVIRDIKSNRMRIAQ